MKLSNLFLTLAVALSGSFAFAHGEDKPGPSGGEIRMPGAFHTEAITLEKNKLKVYVLDINWQNPTVEDSSVEATFVGHHKSKAKCAKEKDFFVCSFGDDVNLKGKGTLEIQASYKKQKGNTATYKTPLKYPSSKAQPQSQSADSGSHHSH